MNPEKETEHALRLLVSIDFSDCCRRGLRMAVDFAVGRTAEFILLHVIDQRFVQECIRAKLAAEDDVKKRLFMDVKALERALGSRLEISAEQQVVGALGAALIAREHSTQ